MVIRFDENAHGLYTDKQRHINRMLQDYDRNLSLRKIGDRDPILASCLAKFPQHTYGVWEEGVQRADLLGNWVFTLAEMSIDERVLARIVANDMTKAGVPERMAKLRAHHESEELSMKKRQMEEQEARREEMIAVGRLAGQKSSVRHKIKGEDVVIGDTLRSPRTLIL